MVAAYRRVLRTLYEARVELEQGLQQLEAFRALQQLDARLSESRPLDVIDASSLRRLLTDELSSQPGYVEFCAIRRALDCFGLDDAALNQLAATETDSEAADPAGIGSHGPALGEHEAIFAPPDDPPRFQPHFPLDGAATEATAHQVLHLTSRLCNAPALHSQPEDEFDQADLTLIRGIDDELAARLGMIGVVRIGQIAAWSAIDCEAASEFLGERAAIAADNWIEQAAILAGGKLTHHARSVLRLRRQLTAPDAGAEAATAGQLDIQGSAQESRAVPMPVPVISEKPDGPMPGSDTDRAAVSGRGPTHQSGRAGTDRQTASAASAAAADSVAAAVAAANSMRSQRSRTYWSEPPPPVAEPSPVAASDLALVHIEHRMADEVLEATEAGPAFPAVGTEAAAKTDAYEVLLDPPVRTFAGPVEEAVIEIVAAGQQQAADTGSGPYRHDLRSLAAAERRGVVRRVMRALTGEAV
jgi:predicted flap endonuclease-1-like 5' DNA nuclease